LLGEEREMGNPIEQPHHQGKNNAERTQDMVRRKQIFLDAFEEWGTIRKSCTAAGVAMRSYRRWVSEDPDFVGELDLRKESFADQIEEIAFDRVRNPDKGKGGDILLIALLNASKPQKYRPQVVMSEGAAKDLISEWRKAAQGVQRDPEKEQEVLPNAVQDTLMEILERRGNAPEEKEGE